jgi:hypothetical protein
MGIALNLAANRKLRCGVSLLASHWDEVTQGIIGMDGSYLGGTFRDVLDSRRLSAILVAAVLDFGRRHGVKAGRGGSGRRGGSGGVAMGIIGGGSGLGAPVRGRNQEDWFF